MWIKQGDVQILCEMSKSYVGCPNPLLEVQIKSSAEAEQYVQNITIFLVRYLFGEKHIICMGDKECSAVLPDLQGHMPD